MSAAYIGQKFQDLRSIGLAPTIEGMEFVRCRFENCVLRTVQDPARRSLLKDLLLKDSQVTDCKIDGAVVRNCTVENLASKQFIILYGCAFEQVTLKGRVDRLWCRGLASPLPHDVPIAQAFDAANAKFYENVGWALDIREVQVARELQIDGVPIHLIRRDPERHVVFRRAKALEGRWREYDLSDAGTVPILLKDLVESGPEAGIVVIPDKDPRREHIVAAVKMLREAGIAEPD